MSAFAHLKKYTGSRYENNAKVAELCEIFDTLDDRDVVFMMVAVFADRALSVQPNKMITGSHFHQPSEVDQRTFHSVDGIIYNTFDKLPFVEMSPVQPFGLNAAVAGLSQSKILATVRSSEVNADITTSIFRLAYAKFLRNNSKLTEIASIGRITRAQSYNPKTKFLPHFRMFGHVSVSRQGKYFEVTEIGHLLRHICADYDLMQAFMKLPDAPMKSAEVELGDARIMQKLIEKGEVKPDEIRRHTTDPDYRVFEEFGIDLPETLPLDSPQLYEILHDLDLDHVATELKEFYDKAMSSRPDVAKTMYFRLNRIADTGYYRGICFNIYASDAAGLRLPVANGGYADWAQKINKHSDEICIISGIGSELIARYFFPKNLVG